MDEAINDTLGFFKKNHQFLWLAGHFVIISLLIISHRPDAILHPQFWAEDGHDFYHDAYTDGVISLAYPLGGYLNSFSRLTAFFAVQFPLTFAPAIFVFFAFVVQILPPMIVLSKRIDKAIPSVTFQVALAYFYAIMPDSWEINLNLTDAQWHLAMVSFLIVATPPKKFSAISIADLMILTVSGLSGPFSLFLSPIALFEFMKSRARTSLTYALVLVCDAIIQIVLILSVPLSERVSDSLGISGARFCEILVDQIMLGGMLGNTLMSVAMYETRPYWAAIAMAFAGFFLVMLVIALRRSPGIFRSGVCFAALLFCAALVSPLLAMHGRQWLIMTYPGHGMRYYIFPSLVWFAAMLICLASDWMALRLASCMLIICGIFGADMEWRYPQFQMTNFTALAETFENSPPGTTMSFPENPEYDGTLNRWAMVLTKR